MSNRPFQGFPSKTLFTPIPNVFFASLLPQINDVGELKVVLHIFWLLYQKRGGKLAKFVTFNELLADKTLMQGMAMADSPKEALRTALELAVDEGILIHQSVDRAGEQEQVYFLNSESGKEVLGRLQQGEIVLGMALPAVEPHVRTEEPPNIFTLYEQNIGLIVPMIAEELREAERLYPASWIEEAFKEAVSHNKRNWRYISRILERWMQEDKGSGEPGRHLEKGSDPDKYVKGKYGHLVRR